MGMMSARMREYAVVAAFAIGVLACAPQAFAADAFALHQRLPTLRSLVAHAPPRAAAATATADPICDIFANGYDVPGATPCAGCFDGTVDFDESDVDCGGPDCKACADGLACTAGTDCQSGICTGNVCTSGLLHLVISQVQSRGVGGAADEFVEIYNPTNAAVTFDSGWTLTARSSSAVSYSSRFTGAGQTIPAHGHFLLTGASYARLVAADGALSSGITDASSLVLSHNNVVVDALCYAFDVATQAVFATIGYTCEGTPMLNPHDNLADTDTDAGIERKPGGASGNTQDTDDNSADFVSNAPTDPHNTSSPPTP